MKRIYLVEDDDNIRKLICYAFTREGYEVEGFPCPGEFYARYAEQKPDLILLDIMLPEEDGLSILQKIRKEDEDMPIVMLTAKDSEFDKVTGLDMGADDYIAKPFGMTELASRVRAVLRRSGRSSKNASSSYQIGELFVDLEKHEVMVGKEKISLSFKEYTLLTELLKAEGRVVSREDLFTKIWGEYYGESRTLDVHISNLRNKLLSAGKYIVTIKNRGYKIGGGEGE